MVRTRAFDEIIDFITSMPKNEQILSFKPSQTSIQRLEFLMDKKKVDNLSEEEIREIDQFLLIEHLMRVAKARARKRLSA